MRFAALALAALIAVPVLAAGGSSYHNQRFGATIDIPAGFTPTGPEMANSDGLTFWDKKGAMIIVFGANVPGKDFEAFAESRYAHARDYDHYSDLAKTITPDWAEISGSSGHQQLRERIISSCDGRQAVAVQYTARSISSSIWSSLKRSLKAGPASSC
jgi:hypothetical protein